MKYELIVRVDSREQHVLPFAPHVVIERGSLGNHSGDYAAMGFEEFAVIERKNPADLLQSLSREYERFRVELNHLAFERRIPHRIVLVEAPDLWSICPHNDTGRRLQAQIDTIQFRYGFGFVWKRTREEAARYAERALQWVVDTYSDETVAAAERAAREVLPTGMRGGARIAHDAAVKVGKCPQCLRSMPKRLQPSCDGADGVCACGRKRRAA